MYFKQKKYDKKCLLFIETHKTIKHSSYLKQQNTANKVASIKTMLLLLGLVDELSLSCPTSLLVLVATFAVVGAVWMCISFKPWEFPALWVTVALLKED